MKVDSGKAPIFLRRYSMKTTTRSPRGVVKKRRGKRIKSRGCPYQNRKLSRIWRDRVSDSVSQWVVVYLYITSFDLPACFTLSFSLLFNFLRSLPFYRDLSVLLFTLFHTTRPTRAHKSRVRARLPNKRSGVHTRACNGHTTRDPAQECCYDA